VIEWGSYIYGNQRDWGFGETLLILGNLNLIVQLKVMVEILGNQIIY
jgi:hypothetical protein